MDSKITLDSDFLINFLRNKDEERAFIIQNEALVRFSTTIINLFELYHGAYKSKSSKANIEKIDLLQERIDILGFNEQIAKDAAKTFVKLQKMGNSIDFRDLFIGAIAKGHKNALKTNNKKHFTKIEGLKVV